MGVIEKFMPLLMEKEEEGLLTPILQTNDCTFSYIKYNNLYIVSTTKKNANIALVFVLLHKIVQVSMSFEISLYCSVCSCAGSHLKFVILGHDRIF